MFLRFNTRKKDGKECTGANYSVELVTDLLV
jgi:hypothetical protein